SRVPGEGLVATSGAGAELLTDVEGSPRWAVQAEIDAGFATIPPTVVRVGADGTRQLLGVLTSTESFKGPWLAASTLLPDGGAMVVVTAFDALLSAELSGAPQLFSEARELKVKAVPI